MLGTTDISNFPIKILAQVADNEPIVIGVYELPVYAGERSPSDGGNCHFDLTCGNIDPQCLAEAVNSSLIKLRNL